MFCPNCGFNLGEQDLNFCKNCGYLLKKMLSVSNTRQDSDSLPSRVDSPLQQHDISYKSLRWLEAPPPPQHNKPHVSSIEHTQETFSYPPAHKQIFDERSYQKPNTHKQRRLLVILISALVLIIASGIYLIFFSGLTCKKPAFSEQTKLSFESIDEGEQKHINNELGNSDIIFNEQDKLLLESTDEREQRFLNDESANPDITSEPAVTRKYKEKMLKSQEPAGFIYHLFTDGTIEIAGASARKKTSINIPQEIDGLLVTSIGNEAFGYCDSLKEITIPDSVTSIGKGAFGDCSSLANITIPDSVTSIDDWAFVECSSLTEIAIPDSVISIGSGAFAYCASLKEITIPDSVINIDTDAFFGCYSLTTAIIPYQLEYCGCEVFPKHTDIRDHSGQSRPLYAQEDEYIYTLLNQSYSGLVGYRGNAEKVHIPEKIGGKLVVYLEYTFASNKDITDVIIPDSVTSIGKEAFGDCSSLANITIPDSVTSIDDWAFVECSSLTEIAIPDSVTSIGYESFRQCSSLTEITIPDSVTSMGNNVFFECSHLVKIAIPDSVISIGKNAFFNCKSLREIIISDSITSIEWGTFNHCSSLAEITIPNSVTRIDGNAFQNCSSLTEITIPDSVTIIGELAFYGCQSLTEITIPDSIISIGNSAFLDCESLTQIHFSGSREQWQAITKNVNICTEADVMFGK